MADRLRERETDIQQYRKQGEDLTKQLDHPFEHEQKLTVATKRQQEIVTALDITKSQASAKLDEGAEQTGESVAKCPTSHPQEVREYYLGGGMTPKKLVTELAQAPSLAAVSGEVAERGPTGHLVPISTVGEVARAFVPAPLQPAPPLVLDDSLHELLQAASLALGRLDGLSDFLPDRQVVLYSYVRKEAVLSSQIEGIEPSLSDFLRHELDAAPGVPMDDVEEVS